MTELLRLESEYKEQALRYKMKISHYENKQRVLNAGINIITTKMRYDMLALFHKGLTNGQ